MEHRAGGGAADAGKTLAPKGQSLGPGLGQQGSARVSRGEQVSGEGTT